MKTSILYIFSVVFSVAYAQVDTNSELFQTLKAKDSLLFDRAFNYCEGQYLEALTSEDFEFYHDQSGIIESKQDFLNIMKEGICNPNNETKSRRELVAGTLEVFPLYNNGKLYAALQKGTHRFFEKRNGAPEQAGSTALFTHLWKLENDQWKLIRVLSYNHH
ncbi:MAG TPA: nuclear transport factor 2 family protein [Flavobacteriaceae bacterium]|nr:DUF4440 domain-containing protein [Flavobacteriaceae bacterium]HAT66278.1 nuclear transport factor 2 family protein [Flavobacteriaceae bacterium]|tara:strand:+ start:240 stop:725 length:486 start_codon:yes stop_codon:yes gene_type:complete